MSRESVFSLKPRGIGELLDLTFRIYRHRFAVFATVGVGMGVLNTATALTLQVAFQAGGAYPDPNLDPVGFLITLYSMLPLLLAASLLIYSTGSSVVFTVVRGVITGRETGAKEALATEWKRIPSMFFTALLSWILILIGCFFCLLPGIAAAILFSMAVPVALLERRSPFSALARSVELIQKRGPRGIVGENNAVRVLVIGLVTLVVWYALNIFSSIPQAAAMSIGMLGDRGMVMTPLGLSPLPMAWMLPLYFIGAVAQGIFLGITLIPWAVLYFDIRVRHEGLDMEEKIHELRARPDRGGA